MTSSEVLMPKREWEAATQPLWRLIATTWSSGRVVALFHIVSSDCAWSRAHVRTYWCSYIGAYVAAKQPRHEVRVSTWLGGTFSTPYPSLTPKPYSTHYCRTTLYNCLTSPNPSFVETKRDARMWRGSHAVGQLLEWKFGLLQSL